MITAMDVPVFGIVTYMVDQIDQRVGEADLGAAGHIARQANTLTADAQAVTVCSQASKEYVTLCDDVLASFGYLFSDAGNDRCATQQSPRLSTNTNSLAV